MTSTPRPPDAIGPDDTAPTQTTAPDATNGVRPAPTQQARNPLHGVTLEAMVVALSEHFGWAELGQRIPVRCFQQDPSVNSSLKFLRKTPWARTKVESLYLFMLRDQRRNARP
jgi:uncharacterized protein (DUF2132 family)